MMKHTIITIGRQFGSGGHEVGNRLAERLDIPLYDHNLIRMAAQELRISSEDATQVDETILGRFLTAYIVSTGNYTAFMSGDESGEPLSDLVFNRQSGNFCRKMCGLYPRRLFKLHQYVYLCI